MTHHNPSPGIDPDVPAHTWNDAPKTDAEDLLREAQGVVLNLSLLLDAAFDDMNAGHAPMRATAMVEIARDTARALAHRMTEE
ncbi:MAG: hypothetical protein ACK4GO_13380 [Gemmobacter sp.]